MAAIQSGGISGAVLPGSAEADTAPPKSRSSYVPLALALVILLILCVVLWLVAVYLSGVEYAYSLDDTYIHLARAQNFAEYGVWGVEPDRFSSAATSLAGPAQLALCLKVVGRQDWLPLALNAIWA